MMPFPPPYTPCSPRPCLLVLAASLLLVACGGDSGSPADSGAAPGETVWYGSVEEFLTGMPDDVFPMVGGDLERSTAWLREQRANAGFELDLEVSRVRHVAQDDGLRRAVVVFSSKGDAVWLCLSGEAAGSAVLPPWYHLDRLITLQLCRGKIGSGRYPGIEIPGVSDDEIDRLNAMIGKTVPVRIRIEVTGCGPASITRANSGASHPGTCVIHTHATLVDMDGETFGSS